MKVNTWISKKKILKLGQLLSEYDSVTFNSSDVSIDEYPLPQFMSENYCCHDILGKILTACVTFYSEYLEFPLLITAEISGFTEIPDGIYLVDVKNHCYQTIYYKDDFNIQNRQVILHYFVGVKNILKSQHLSSYVKGCVEAGRMEEYISLKIKEEFNNVSVFRCIFPTNSKTREQRIDLTSEILIHSTIFQM